MRHLYIQGFVKNYILPYLINPFNQFFLTDGCNLPFSMSPTKNLIYHNPIKNYKMEEKNL